MWYPGHQSKALRQLEKGIGHIDLVVEVRDARIPLTSTNHQFEQSLSNRKRVVVFNKCDLADMAGKKRIRDALLMRGTDCLFTSSSDDRSVRDIIRYGIGKGIFVGFLFLDMARRNPQMYPTLSMVLVGLPNGKL